MGGYGGRLGWFPLNRGRKSGHQREVGLDPVGEMDGAVIIGASVTNDLKGRFTRTKTHLS